MTGRKRLTGILDKPIGELSICARIGTDISAKKIEIYIHIFILSD